MLVRTVAIAALAGVAALAGCGGSGRLSHADFVRSADGICSRYDARVKRLGTPRTLAQIERYAARVLPIYRRAVGELAALAPPRQDEPAVRAWLASDRRVERQVESLLAAVRTRRLPDVRAAARRTGAADARSNRLARRLGLKICSKP